MIHTVTVPKEVLGTDVRVDYVYSRHIETVEPLTFRPVVVSGDIEYDHDTMNEDVVNYILDMNSEDMEAEELDYLESRVDGYIESMINERRI